MAKIKQFEFQRPKLVEIRSYRYGHSWPVAYILSGDGKTRKAYVGETVDAHRRTKEHLSDPEKEELEKIHIITDYDFNQSATKDIESKLIQYLGGHKNYELLNGNDGLADTEYYDKPRYQHKFEDIWNQLLELQVVDQDLDSIRNSNLFKYSPYKSLTEEQQGIVDEILKDFKSQPNQPQVHLVEGRPGTGKTVLGSYLLKRLVDQKQDKSLKIGLVVHNRRLRSTLQDALQGAGLKKRMVLSPYDVVGNHYDILIVDEAHLLGRPVSQARIGHFRRTSEKLGLDPKVRKPAGLDKIELNPPDSAL